MATLVPDANNSDLERSPSSSAPSPDEKVPASNNPPSAGGSRAPEYSHEALQKIYDEIWRSFDADPVWKLFEADEINMQKRFCLHSECKKRGIPPPGYNPAPKPFEPRLFFFYGTLMIPEILQRVLGLSEPPVLQKASAWVLTLRMWGQYPAVRWRTKAENERLEENPEPELQGYTYMISSEEQFKRLNDLMNENYELSGALVQYPGEDFKVAGAKVFVWKGDPYDPRLKFGPFDAEAFMAWKRRDFAESGEVRGPIQ
ncbi:hypothetical protein ABW21_db0201274 [Orbilia brochopaga]|nr:hypothetical protein ABW21_db0201274 [Drechslerella brochopaga]